MNKLLKQNIDYLVQQHNFKNIPPRSEGFLINFLKRLVIAGGADYIKDTGGFMADMKSLQATDLIKSNLEDINKKGFITDISNKSKKLLKALANKKKRRKTKNFVPQEVFSGNWYGTSQPMQSEVLELDFIPPKAKKPKAKPVKTIEAERSPSRSQTSEPVKTIEAKPVKTIEAKPVKAEPAKPAPSMPPPKTKPPEKSKKVTYDDLPPDIKKKIKEYLPPDYSYFRKLPTNIKQIIKSFIEPTRLEKYKIILKDLLGQDKVYTKEQLIFGFDAIRDWYQGKVDYSNEPVMTDDGLEAYLKNLFKVKEVTLPNWIYGHYYPDEHEDPESDRKVYYWEGSNGRKFPFDRPNPDDWHKLYDDIIGANPGVRGTFADDVEESDSENENPRYDSDEDEVQSRITSEELRKLPGTWEDKSSLKPDWTDIIDDKPLRKSTSKPPPKTVNELLDSASSGSSSDSSVNLDAIATSSDESLMMTDKSGESSGETDSSVNLVSEAESDGSYNSGYDERVDKEIDDMLDTRTDLEKQIDRAGSSILGASEKEKKTFFEEYQKFRQQKKAPKKNLRGKSSKPKDEDQKEADELRNLVSSESEDSDKEKGGGGEREPEYREINIEESSSEEEKEEMRQEETKEESSPVESSPEESSASESESVDEELIQGWKGFYPKPAYKSSEAFKLKVAKRIDLEFPDLSEIMKYKLKQDYIKDKNRKFREGTQTISRSRGINDIINYEYIDGSWKEKVTLSSVSGSETIEGREEVVEESDATTTDESDATTTDESESSVNLVSGDEDSGYETEY